MQDLRGGGGTGGEVSDDDRDDERREVLLEILRMAIQGLCARGPTVFTVAWDNLAEGGLSVTHECLIQTTYRSEGPPSEVEDDCPPEECDEG